MGFYLTQTTAPVSEPVTLSEAKLFLRIDETSEDALVAGLIAAARGRIEAACGRSLPVQAWEYRDVEFNGAERVALPRGPVRAVSEVASLDAAGNAAVVSNSAWSFSVGEEAVRLALPIAGSGLRVRYQTGYDTDLPPALKQAVLQLVLWLYEARQPDDGGLPPSVTALLAPYRTVRL